MKSHYCKYIRDYARAGYVSINSCLKDVYQSFSVKFEERTVDENWTLYQKNKLTHLVERSIPLTRSISDNWQPWYDKTVYSLANKKKKRLYKRARSVNNLSLYDAYHAYHARARTYKTIITDAKTIIYTHDLPNILTNPKKSGRW